MRAVIGIDMGTQTTKAQVVACDGQLLGYGTAEVPFTYPEPDGVEQDPAQLVDAVIEAIGNAVRAAPDATDILAIGIDGQMGGAIGIGADFEPVTPYESWLDTRADQRRAELLDRRGTGILAANGIIPFVAPRVARWFDATPTLGQRLSKVLAPTGYVTGRLTGLTCAAEATCDRTQAHLFGCFDVAVGQWDPALASAVGLTEELLPRVVEPTEIVGRLTPAVAERCGVAAGIPVAGGLGDGTAGWVASGAFEPGNCVDTGGSSEHFAVTGAEFAPDPYPGTLLTCMPSAAPGRYHLFGFTGGTGLTRRWWADIAADGEHDALERVAAELPVRPGDPLAIPHLHGMLSPFDPHVRGAFVGFDESSEPAHIYRALFEALAFESADWIERAMTLSGTVRPSSAVAIGGAAQSAVGAQLKADVLGLTYARMRPHVNAARGAALVAAVAAGATELDEPAWHDPELTVLQRHEPDPEAGAVYQDRRRIYGSMLSALRPVYREMAALRGCS